MLAEVYQLYDFPHLKESRAAAIRDQLRDQLRPSEQVVEALQEEPEPQAVEPTLQWEFTYDTSVLSNFILDPAHISESGEPVHALSWSDWARMSDIRSTFRELADRWRDETSHLSSYTARILHPAYLQIIGMGQPALRFIFEELRDRGGHWGLALQSITRESPVSMDDAGDVGKIKAVWLEWGRQHGYLSA